MLILIRQIKEAISSATYGNSALKTLIDALQADVTDLISNAGFGVSTWLQPRVVWLLNKFDTTFRSEKKLYPTLAAGVTITGAAGVRAQGAWVEVVPATTIVADFVVCRVVVQSITGLHQLQIGRGASGSEVSVGTVFVTAAGVYELHTPVVAANSRVAMRTASEAGGAETLVARVQYANIVGSES